MKYINHITEDERKTLNRITDDCKKIHILQPPKCFLSLDLHSKDGVHLEHQEMLSKSWVRNFYNALACISMGLNANNFGSTYGAGQLNPTKTNGTVSTYNAGILPNINITLDNFYFGESGITTQGIVIGVGTGAESFEDYALGTLIANGTGAGQMTYAGQSKTSSYDPGTKKVTAVHTRIINNNSGGDINVSEVAWYAFLYCNGPINIMLTRDLLSTAVTVANTAQLTVTYTIELTYPA